MAKTITAMLIGIAISEGAIHSVDDTVQTYVPELTGKEIGKTPIQAFLHMASGIAFTQTSQGAARATTRGSIENFSGKTKSAPSTNLALCGPTLV
ncbi:CubicO group peptidase (beta-lactamase class C family) [Rhizobium mongolense]